MALSTSGCRRRCIWRLTLFKGDEDEAVELLSQHLQEWLDSIGPHRCAGCGQVRGEDAPMLSCDRCRVALHHSKPELLSCCAWKRPSFFHGATALSYGINYQAARGYSTIA